MIRRRSAGRAGPTEKLMRAALLTELQQEGAGDNGGVDQKIRLIARRLVDRAAEGDTAAIKELFDRVDGRAIGAAAGEGPRRITHEEALDQLD